MSANETLLADQVDGMQHSKPMSNMRANMLLVLVPLLSGCQAMVYGTAAQLNEITIGMTRSEVVEKLGEPDTRSAIGDAEILKYKWMKTVVAWGPTYFFVRLVDGKVESFGEERELHAGQATDSRK